MERDNSAARRDTSVDRSSYATIQAGEPTVPVNSPDCRIPSTAQPPHHNGSPIPSAEASVTDRQSVQVFPAPEPHVPKPEARAVTTAALLTKLRTPYDRYDRYLRRLHKQLQPSASAQDGTADVAPENGETPPVCTYPTPLGRLSFPELHERTRRYAAFALRHTYEVNEADIDDGLQAGYLRLWQRLEQQPHLLEDKGLAWIGIGIVYTALHATRKDWQFRRQTRADGEQALQEKFPSGKGSSRAHSGESRQVDIRIDVQRAVGAVAERILTEQRGKRQDHDLWALYGLTMQQVSASELSRLFGVREQSMQAAYQRVRGWLQEALPNYRPSGATTPVTQRGREALPQQDMGAIKRANGDVPDAVYATVRTFIVTTNADTRQQDEWALEGIRGHIPVQTQAQTYGVSQAKMQRAYARVHLMIGAERDPNVRVRRPERRVRPVFTLTPASAAAVEALALDFLQQPKSYEKLVALHAHISNLAISTTAKHFNLPTSTLRYYAQQIGRQLMTPTQPARETTDTIGEGQGKAASRVEKPSLKGAAQEATSFPESRVLWVNPSMARENMSKV